MLWYCEAPSPVGYGDRAKAALDWCASDLGLPSVSLRWFRESGELEAKALRRTNPNTLVFCHTTSVIGMFRPLSPDEILVNISLARAGDTLEGTVSHESFHAWQLREYGLMLDQAELVRENQANAYASRVTPRIKRAAEEEESELLRLLAGLKALLAEPPRQQAARR